MLDITMPRSVTTCILAAVGTMSMMASTPLGAQAPAPARSAESDAERARCTTEEYDLSADCGLRIRARNAQREAKAAKNRAPVDLTGYWVAVVSEDWRWRMATAPKGDLQSLPANDEGVRVANQWDPKEIDSCKAYGAPGLMRNPLRAHIEWDGDRVLRLETDHGEQKRLFNFAPARETPGRRSLQGYSSASWDQSGLKVVTTNLTAGYLRRNGIPYSENTVLTEYYNVYSAFGEQWLTITTIVHDPTYLARDFMTSLDFKKLADGSAWKPTPCNASPDTRATQRSGGAGQ
jgi:hypothetical protein